MRALSTILLAALLPGSASAAEHFGGKSFFVGDLHVHTGVSGDGGSTDVGNPCHEEWDYCGAVADLFTTARANGLDFVSVTDHVNQLHVADQALFDNVINRVRDAHDPDAGFVTIPAAEIHFTLEHSEHAFGHKNLYLFGDEDQVADFNFETARFNGDESKMADCDDTWPFVDKIADRFGPVLLLPHHPAARIPMPVDWDCTHSEYTPAVEMYSVHGNSMRAEVDYDPLWGGVNPDGPVHEAVNPDRYDLRLGFFSSTDTHDSRPGAVCEVSARDDEIRYGGGLAVVVQEEGAPFDRLAIYDALRERRTYATSGPMIPVLADYFVDGELVGEMGDVIAVPDGAPLTVRVRVPSPLAPYITEVEIITLERDYPAEAFTGGIWEARLSEPPTMLYPRLKIDGDLWYGEAGCADGGDTSEERIWLSPTYIGEPGDTGVGGGDSDPDDSDPAGHDSDPIIGDSAPPGVDSGPPAADGGGAPPKEGCACDPSGGLGGAWVFALAALGWRRRRQSP